MHSTRHGRRRNDMLPPSAHCGRQCVRARRDVGVSESLQGRVAPCRRAACWELNSPRGTPHSHGIPRPVMFCAAFRASHLHRTQAQQPFKKSRNAPTGLYRRKTGQASTGICNLQTGGGATGRNWSLTRLGRLVITGPGAQWIRPTELGIAGSSLAGVIILECGAPPALQGTPMAGPTCDRMEPGRPQCTARLYACPRGHVDCGLARVRCSGNPRLIVE